MGAFHKDLWLVYFKLVTKKSCSHFKTTTNYWSCGKQLVLHPFEFSSGNIEKFNKTRENCFLRPVRSIIKLTVSLIIDLLVNKKL